jgi:hypothetical protein
MVWAQGTFNHLNYKFITMLKKIENSLRFQKRSENIEKIFNFYKIGGSALVSLHTTASIIFKNGKLGLQGRDTKHKINIIFVNTSNCRSSNNATSLNSCILRKAMLTDCFVAHLNQLCALI